MPHKPKPTTTPALIDKAKKCTSSKEVIQTLFSTKHMPNPVQRAEAKKIFLKEGIPWPSARGRKRKGKVVKKIREVGCGHEPEPYLPFTPPDIESESMVERVNKYGINPVAYCPACGAPLANGTITKCPGCGKELDIEIHTRTIITVTAK